MLLLGEIIPSGILSFLNSIPLSATMSNSAGPGETLRPASLLTVKVLITDCPLRVTLSSITPSAVPSRLDFTSSGIEPLAPVSMRMPLLFLILALSTLRKLTTVRAGHC